MGYRDYPSKIPTDLDEREKFLRKLGLEHLLRAWQWFEVYHLAPYTPPYFSLPKEAYMNDTKGGVKIVKKGDDEGGEGKSGFKIIDLDNGLLAFDFGDYLSVSAGENYGLLATGRVIRTAEKMIDLLIERGATEIAFAKDCLEPAKLAAWVRAVNHGVNVFDYKPQADDVHRLEHVYQLATRAVEEVIQPD